jgi:hypothetical protein
MRNKFVIYLIILIPAFGLGQAKSSVDFLAGLDYSYRHLRHSSDEPHLIYIINQRNSFEVSNYGWRAGFNYNKRIDEKYHLKTGLRFASVGYKTLKRDLLLTVEPEEPDPHMPKERQFFYNYWFIEIPIAVRMELNEKKLSPFFEIGFSPSIYIISRKKTKTDIETEIHFQNESSLGLRKLHLVGFVSVGANYAISANIQLFAQPAFRYHLTSLFDAPIKGHLYSFGIEAGARRLFSGKLR